MKIYLLFTSLAALIMFAGAAISSDMVTPQIGPVKIKNYAFGPNTVTATPGSEVVWVNNDSASHSIVIDGHQSPRLRNGSEFRHTFSAAGEYHYQCGIHKSMKGTVIIAKYDTASMPQGSAKKPRPVIENTTSSMSPTPIPSTAIHPKAVQKNISAEKNTISIVDFMRFSPAVLSVAAGTEVTWSNHDGSNHIIQVGNVRSPRLRHDASFSYRFDKPGEYPYICGIHGNKMSGKIIVE